MLEKWQLGISHNFIGRVKQIRKPSAHSKTKKIRSSPLDNQNQRNFHSEANLTIYH